MFVFLNIFQKIPTIPHISPFPSVPPGGPTDKIGRLQKLQSARTPKKFRIIIPNTDANLLYVYNPRIDAIQFESFDRTNFEIFLN